MNCKYCNDKPVEGLLLCLKHIQKMAITSNQCRNSIHTSPDSNVVKKSIRIKPNDDNKTSDMTIYKEDGNGNSISRPFTITIKTPKGNINKLRHKNRR